MKGWREGGRDEEVKAVDKRSRRGSRKVMT